MVFNPAEAFKAARTEDEARAALTHLSVDDALKIHLEELDRDMARWAAALRLALQSGDHAQAADIERFMAELDALRQAAEERLAERAVLAEVLHGVGNNAGNGEPQKVLGAALALALGMMAETINPRG